MLELFLIVIFYLLPIITIVFLMIKASPVKLFTTGTLLIIYTLFGLNISSNGNISSNIYLAVQIVSIFSTIICGAIVSISLKEIRDRYIKI
jgi:uncharacterized membrane protein